MLQKETPAPLSRIPTASRSSVFCKTPHLQRTPPRTDTSLGGGARPEAATPTSPPVPRSSTGSRLPSRHQPGLVFSAHGTFLVPGLRESTGPRATAERLTSPRKAWDDVAAARDSQSFVAS